MTIKQIWLTIALDLERAANLKAEGRGERAEFFIREAKTLYDSQKKTIKMKKIHKFIKFDGNPEDLLLGSSLITARIQ